MNNRNVTYDLVLGGLFIAFGVLLPMIFHLFSMTGPIFLPMHIPVLIAGLLLPTHLAVIVGVLTPLISSLLTGMPVMMPMGMIMAFELGTYGLTISIARRKFNLPIIVALLISMVVGRVAAGFAVFLLVLLIGAEMNPILFVQGAIVTGIPGMIVQIIVIPPLVRAIYKYTKLSPSNA